MVYRRCCESYSSPSQHLLTLTIVKLTSFEHFRDTTDYKAQGTGIPPAVLLNLPAMLYPDQYLPVVDRYVAPLFCGLSRNHDLTALLLATMASHLTCWRFFVAYVDSETC